MDSANLMYVTHWLYFVRVYCIVFASFLISFASSRGERHVQPKWITVESICQFMTKAARAVRFRADKVTTDKQFPYFFH